MQKIELLAPAGDLDRLKVACDFGADAVYLGGKRFSLRSAASNFTLEMIQAGVRYAHERGKKVFVTVNMILHDDDFVGLESYLQALEELGVDAIIVAGPAVLALAKQVAPRLAVHISTQYSVTNSAAIDFYRSLGADRVILAREVTLSELASLMDKANLPVEVFIHGAMCANYSGHCTLSNYLTLRDANRGGCAHSCRWAYQLIRDDLDLSQGHEPFTMSAKDLRAVDVIPELIRLGVTSLKIEGRMKSDFYIATVVGAYRRLIDTIYRGGDWAAVSQWAKAELAHVENRFAGAGFYPGITDQEDQIYGAQYRAIQQNFVARVVDYDPVTAWTTLEIRNPFTCHDLLEIMRPFYISPPFQAQVMCNGQGEPTERFFRPMEIVKIKAQPRFEVGDYIRKAT